MAFVWCAKGFDPGSQSAKPRKELAPAHPTYARCSIDFPQPVRVVLYRLADRADVLLGHPCVVEDKWGEQHIEMRLKKPADGGLNRRLLHRQLESIEIGKGARYAEIAFRSYHESVQNAK